MYNGILTTVAFLTAKDWLDILLARPAMGQEHGSIDGMDIASLLSVTAHRPFPLTTSPWAMTQTWSDLLFAHWPVAPDRLRDFVPHPLQIDLFDGTAWFGLIPLRMVNVCPRGLPPLPWLSNFLELNVRTYVTYKGKPGVYFFSLDASNPVAVQVARMTYQLPYFRAAMTCQFKGQSIDYASRRTHSASPPLAFQASYQPCAPAALSKPGSIEHFLTERYCLLLADKKGQIYCGDVHHRQWQLQPAEAEIRVNTMGQEFGIALAAKPALLHFAKTIDTIEWPLAPVI